MSASCEAMLGIQIESSPITAARSISPSNVARSGTVPGVGSITPTEPEIVSAHAMLGFEMADHGLYGGPAT